MNDWNPELYLKYEEERLEPAKDLLAKINHPHPRCILDLGCGAGNSTQLLGYKYPHAQIVGEDKSEAMIQQARKHYPSGEWIHREAEDMTAVNKYDVVFSNAMIQWIDDQNGLFRKIHSALRDKGIIGFQLPLFWEMQLGKVISQTVSSERWSYLQSLTTERIRVHTVVDYYNMLSEIFPNVSFWHTTYYHQFSSAQEIFELIKSTGLKPYYPFLSDEAVRCEFESCIAERISSRFQPESNGQVLLPFKRLFFVCTK